MHEQSKVQSFLQELILLLLGGEGDVGYNAKIHVARVKEFQR
jgi:hypothetical protein